MRGQRDKLVQSVVVLVFAASTSLLAAQEMQRIPLQAEIQNVQPMTGIVLWSTNESVTKAPVQLEYSYLTYRDVVKGKGEYDWQVVDRLLADAASRKHQLILRWHDTYVGKKTGVPAFIVNSPGYQLVKGKSENKPTEFPDWSSLLLQEFTLEFFSEFAKRYDSDPRLAFVQVGFGLWAEYHIYDGPMKLGATFPSKEYQERFLKHTAKCFQQTPWMISADAANEEWSPLEENEELLALEFGVFDDSFNQKKHAEENEPNWNILGKDRWKIAPTGGEFSFFASVDQKKALAPTGPYGISFEQQAAKFHVSFIIGDAQPEFQSEKRIREAGMATGYAFHIVEFRSATGQSLVEIENRGIAPIYYDAFPVVDGVRAQVSLKGLLPGSKRTFKVQAGSSNPKIAIECDRLVPGQAIEFAADLRK